MARVIAHILPSRVSSHLGILRFAVICGCALALIVARQPLPF